MVKTAIRFSVCMLAAAVFLSAAAASAQTTEYSWRRVRLDGTRDHSKGTAAKELAFLESFAPQMAQLKEVLGYSPAEMAKYAPQSPLGNWTADMMLEQARKISNNPCDLSIINIGGIRIDMPKGNVMLEDIRSMFPFKNAMVIVHLTGKRVLEIFNQMNATKWQAFSGATVVADREGVKSIEVGGQPLDPEKEYTLSTVDFLLTGGDGFYFGEDVLKVENMDISIFNLVLKHLSELKEAGRNIESNLDDRVKLLYDLPVAVADDPKFECKPLSGPDDAKLRLTILHTNDTHSHLEPIRSGHLCGYGGVVERAAFVDSVRRSDGARKVLLLDAGDFEQGTPYFALFKGKAEIGAMNIMKYDAAVMGNHEWDNGAEDLVSRMRTARFKTLLANYSFDDPKIAASVQPYAIFRRAGMKIGVIGVLTDVTPNVKGEYVSSLHYADPVEPANKWASFLKKEKKCDLVILLSHIGIEGEDNNRGDLMIAPYLHDIDMIIGGHSHTDLPAPVFVPDADGKKVMIVTDFFKGYYIGEIKIYNK